MRRVLLAMFSRRWLLTTLLVFAGSALCARLGIWQLDRLEQRRAFNAHVAAMVALPPIDVNAAGDTDLRAMEFRAVRAEGAYDLENQVAVRNQYHDGELGFHLLTPLVLEDGRAILVDRGWIPAAGNAQPADWRKYDETGPVVVAGILRLGTVDILVGGGAPSQGDPGESRRDFWNSVDLAGVERQSPYAMLPAYIQPDVDPTDPGPPIPFRPELQLSEGPHLGYAGQWFVFAGLLFFGYPFFYLRKQVQT
jgi:surfeit locus 1 family protein